MRYTKFKNEEGHFHDFDNTLLIKELEVGLDPMKNGVDFNCYTEDIGRALRVARLGDTPWTQVEKDQINALIAEHGSEEQVLQRAKDKRKAEVSANVVAKIRETYSADKEFKIHRKRIKGDIDDYFDDYDDLVDDKTTQGNTLEIAIEACTTLTQVEAVDITIT